MRAQTGTIPFTASIPRHGWNRRLALEIETLDATLRRDPIYGQVPAFAGRQSAAFWTCWRWIIPVGSRWWNSS